MDNYTTCTLENQKGFTLIETLIALMVLTIGILSANAMQISAINTNIRANRVSQSTSWASEQLETLMSLNYDDPMLIDTDGNGTGQDIIIPLDGTDDNGGNFGLDDTVNNAGVIIADQSVISPDSLFTVYWNIAVDKPMVGSKTINVIVTRPKEGRTRDTTITFIKTSDEKARGSIL